MPRVPKKGWNYRIYIYRNGELKKKYIERQTRAAISKIYDNILQASEKTFFREVQILEPESQNYIGVKYHVVLFSKMKDKNKKYINEVITIEDYLGRKHQVSLDGYYISRVDEIFDEEEIYFCNKECYIYLDEIFDEFINKDKDQYRQVCVIGKILLIEYKDDYIVFRLKNEDDALRAHNMLKTLSIKKKLDKVLFFGNTLLFTKREIYKKYLTDKNYETF